MQRTATWNFAPAGKTRLAELLESFGCADVVAPVDLAAFGKRAGELIRQGARGQRLVRYEEESSTNVLLGVLQNAPPSDRHTMVAALTASASLLVAAGALVLLG
jgi:hypothetical protein